MGWLSATGIMCHTSPGGGRAAPGSADGKVSNRPRHRGGQRYAAFDDDSNVAVTTNGTTVTLLGNVRTWAEHDAVVDAAWMAAGIDDVRDELSVSG